MTPEQRNLIDGLIGRCNGVLEWPQNIGVLTVEAIEAMRDENAELRKTVERFTRAMQTVRCAGCGFQVPHGWTKPGVNDCRVCIDNCTGNHGAWAVVQDRIEELEAIVAMLPKCWRLSEAGELVQDKAVTPGMTLFISHPEAPRDLVSWLAYADWHPLLVGSVTESDDYWEYEVTDGYATEEAARAAEREGE